MGNGAQLCGQVMMEWVNWIESTDIISLLVSVQVEVDLLVVELSSLLR